MKKPREVINQLSPQDALAVLKALADSDASLAKRIAEIATEYLSEVDAGDVAEEVYFSLDFLQVEDVWERSGSTRYGYVEPYESYVFAAVNHFSVMIWRSLVKK